MEYKECKVHRGCKGRKVHTIRKVMLHTGYSHRARKSRSRQCNNAGRIRKARMDCNMGIYKVHMARMVRRAHMVRKVHKVRMVHMAHMGHMTRMVRMPRMDHMANNSHLLNSRVQ